MANKPWVIIPLALFCIAASTADYFQFDVLPSQTAFTIHNGLATLCSVLLVVFTWRLMSRGAAGERFHFFVFLIGIWMFLAHMVKLWFSHCI